MNEYKDIKPYIEKGLVTEQAHPEDPDVRIFNYTQTCQFAGAWDEVTKQCRGLILNVRTGEVIARPFPKFFNYQEHVDKGWPIPAEQPVIMEKYDGSLGILYWLKGKPWVATRGSFISDQAMWATEWWRKNVGMDTFADCFTHLFEIIYPENRIVVNYDFSGLVHLCTIENTTGREVSFAWDPPIRTANRSNAFPIKNLLELDLPNQEGFVAYFPNADVRMKIKFPEYVRLHKLVTGLSEIAIWEHLRSGNGLRDLLEKVPDEFFRWVEGVSNKLHTQWYALHEIAVAAYRRVKDMETRKEQALYITKHAKEVAGVVFNMLDNRNDEAHDLVWRMIRPHGRSSFKVDTDS